MFEVWQDGLGRLRRARRASHARCAGRCALPVPWRGRNVERSIGSRALGRREERPRRRPREL